MKTGWKIELTGKKIDNLKQDTVNLKKEIKKVLNIKRNENFK